MSNSSLHQMAGKMKLLDLPKSKPVTNLHEFVSSGEELKKDITAFLMERRKVSFDRILYFYWHKSCIKVVYETDSFEHTHKIKIDTFIQFLILRED